MGIWLRARVRGSVRDPNPNPNASVPVDLHAAEQCHLRSIWEDAGRRLDLIRVRVRVGVRIRVRRGTP